MSYATIDEIKSMFRDYADNADAAVNDTELQLFIDNNTALINAKIGTLYTLPITIDDSPSSFAILKQIQMFGVASIVDDILNSYGEADKKPTWAKQAKSMLDALVPPMDPKTCKQCPPTMILPDASYVGVPEQRNKIKISNTSGNVFKKASPNW